MRLFASYVYQEMELHKGYMRRLGLSLAEAETAPAALDNVSYTAAAFLIGANHIFSISSRI